MPLLLLFISIPTFYIKSKIDSKYNLLIPFREKKLQFWPQSAKLNSNLTVNGRKIKASTFERFYLYSVGKFKKNIWSGKVSSVKSNKFLGKWLWLSLAEGVRNFEFNYEFELENGARDHVFFFFLSCYDAQNCHSEQG